MSSGRRVVSDSIRKEYNSITYDDSRAQHSMARITRSIRPSMIINSFPGKFHKKRSSLSSILHMNEAPS